MPEICFIYSRMPALSCFLVQIGRWRTQRYSFIGLPDVKFFNQVSRKCYFLYFQGEILYSKDLLLYEYRDLRAIEWRINIPI
jgi:hypothetical protein